ncbi:MAG: apolipoprotein N-acyltransferase [Burkholderiaceae bacterium]
MTLSFLLTLFAGLLHAASIATPWDSQPAGWLQLIALAMLAWRLDRTHSPKLGGLHGWVFASAWLTGTFWWLFVALHTYGGLAASLAVVAVVTLAALLALYYGAASWVFVRLKGTSPWSSALLFAALWMLAELARGVWFTGFGWGAAGYAHVDGLGRSASYVGAYGLAALAALIAYLIAAWAQSPLKTRNLASLCGAAGISAVLLWAPVVPTTATSMLDVALLQGNIAQDEKFEAGTGVADSLRWYGEQLGSATATLVVAPETAIPLLPQQLPPGYWAALQEHFRAGKQAALVGVPWGDSVQGYTNAVAGFKPTEPTLAAGAGYRYDKHHLVPFGEFIPPLFRWFTDLMSIPLGDFRRGAVGQPSFEWRGERLAPNICYEDLFGEELAARFIDPAQAPTIFVNVSNIGWFGKTLAIDQHLQISRMRSLEFGRPFIRATNTGDTVIIDQNARVTHALERHTRGVLLGTVQGRAGITPFAWWASRYGLWPLWLSGSLVVVLFAMRRRVGARWEAP